MKAVLLSSIQFLVVTASLAAPTPSATQTPSAMQAPSTVGRLMGTSNSPYTARTAKDFAEACKTDQSSCSAMVGQVMMDRIQFSPTLHICLPGVNYAGRVGPWLADHPEAANMSPGDGIYLAVTTIYKCGPPNNY